VDTWYLYSVDIIAEDRREKNMEEREKKDPGLGGIWGGGGGRKGCSLWMGL